MTKILKEEGFTAIQGVGGFVALGQGDFDVLYHAAVYAPGPYQKSMRMLKTLAGDDFAPPAWVPGNVATYESGYVDVANAFQNVGSLFDATYGEGDAGTFDDIIKGLRDDPNGPQVDVSKEVIGRLGQRVTLITDARKPIGPHSDRSLLAAAAKDEKGLAQAVRKLMENDEDVKRHDLNGNIVLWEMITREKKKKGAEPAAVKAKAPNSAVAVAHGQLLIASDITFLQDILGGKEAGKEKGLAVQLDYQRIAAATAKLAAGKDSLHSFTRPYEGLEPVYEQLRTHQLDKARSWHARLLMDLFGDQLREVDSSKFPPYQAFRPYVGPAGMSCVNQSDGWFLTGFSLRQK
jgi:hypothetical protein